MTSILNKFELVYLVEEWLEHPEIQYKGMFGGLVFYFRGLMVLFIVEDPVQKHYKDKVFDFAIWDGLLLPVEREQHSSILEQFPNLIPHPVLPKWLYLPKSTEGFESYAQAIVTKIFSGDAKFGIVPGQKKRKKSKLMAKFNKTKKSSNHHNRSGRNGRPKDAHLKKKKSKPKRKLKNRKNRA